MWSFGCILHELLNYTTGDKTSKNYCRYFATGNSCFPLSPFKTTNSNKCYKNTNDVNKDTIMAHDKDQLRLIVKKLGV